jgi:hypothetical protein
MRSHGRAISIGLLIVLLIPAFQSRRGWRRCLILGGTLLFFLFELTYVGRALAGGLYGRGMGGIFIYSLTMLVLGMGLSKWLQDWDDVYRAVVCMAGVGVIFSIATICQLAVNPSGIIWQNRLAATGSTATLCAELIVLALLPTSILIVHPRTGKTGRIFWSALTGLLIVFLIWTGTRNGLLMAVVGLGLIFRGRLKQFTWFAIAAVFFYVIAVSVYQSSTLTAGRLFSTLDNRSYAWSNTWKRFVANPLVGDIRDASVVENSYIAVAANLGLIGLVPLALFIFLTSLAILRIQKLKNRFGNEAIIADLVAGGLAAIAVGAIFDGYLLGMLNAPVFCIYIYLAIATFLLDIVQVNASLDAETYELRTAAEAY